MAETTSLDPFQLPPRGFLWASEVRQQLVISAHTLSHWLTEFPMVRAPKKRSQRRRRFYPSDLKLLARIANLRRIEGRPIPEIRDLLFTELPPAERSRCRKELGRSLIGSGGRQKWRFISDLDVSAADIAKYSGVPLGTARRYLKNREAPYAVGALTELYLRGRVLPDSWNHCFINLKGNLELHQIGEVSENDVMNIDWTRRLHYSQVKTLKRQLSKTERRNRQLEKHLEEARRQLGGVTAANDPYRFPKGRSDD